MYDVYYTTIVTVYLYFVGSDYFAFEYTNGLMPGKRRLAAFMPKTCRFAYALRLLARLRPIPGVKMPEVPSALKCSAIAPCSKIQIRLFLWPYKL